MLWVIVLMSWNKDSNGELIPHWGSDGKALFWNNETGWGSFDGADRFTLDETKAYHLPVGGMWICEDGASQLATSQGA